MNDRPDHAAESADPAAARRRLAALLAAQAREPRRVPLAFAQQRLWFLDQLQPGSAAYTIPTLVRLRGPLDHAALQRSLDAIVARHAPLRTTFALHGDQPVQVVAPSGTFPLIVHDFRDLPAAERDAAVTEAARLDVQQPFDLRHGPLARALLFLLAPQEQVVLLLTHHIITDGWSASVLIDELATLYHALTTGRDPAAALPPLTVQYPDYARWQRQWLADNQHQAQLSYWQRQLADLVPLALPTDRPRPPVQSTIGALHSFTIPTALHQELAALQRRTGSTLYMVMLAAFLVLLQRYTSQNDLAVGTPIAGRTRAELEKLIGLFVNTLVLRTDLSGDPSFVELLARVRTTTQDAYAHQDLPFELLVEALHPERDLGHTPLVQVLFVLQNVPPPRAAVATLALEPLPFDPGSAKFDLSLVLTEETSGISAVVEYATALFDAATIARLGQHFVTLLQAIVATPQEPISTLALMPPAERYQTVLGWNATAAAYPADATLPAGLAAQVERTPDAVALIFDETTLTYRALHERVTQLAAKLQALGVGPDVLVGVCMERSLDLVVALLAVVHAGGAYVPLDPDYPAARLEYLIRDAQAAVLLTTPTHLSQLAALDLPCPLHTLATLAALPAAPIAPRPLHPDNLAYLIYTSGSTGQPKGALNTHRAIMNRLRWMQDAYRLTPADRVLQKTPFSFDVSVWEFFWPLLTGATLVLARPGGQQDPAYLAALIDRRSITTLHFVPTMLDAFLDLTAPGPGASLRRIICSGEALPFALAQRTLACFPHAALHNLYGPTEAAVDVTAWTCRTDDLRQPVPIGRPISNTTMLVLDARMQPVPIGVGGDLYIGGVQLARGYHHRPALTAERFVPHPFSPTPGARLYQTGDRARWRADGTIEYLGRSDDQVKVRGVRVELGEIEAALVQHPQVRASAVITAGDSSATYLVGYVVLDGEHGDAPDEAALRAFLQQRLPAALLPAAIVVLDALPHTPNGKLDRRALPPLAPSRPAHAPPYVPPRTPAEQTLVSIWEQVLQRAPIGVTDNFFALGGDSIRSIRVLALAQQQGLACSLPQLFQHPTIAALAQAETPADDGIESVQEPLLDPADQALLPADVEDAYPLAALQAGMLFHSAYSPDTAVYHDVFTLHLVAPFDQDAWENALAALARDHAVLRTAFDLTRFSTPLQLVYRTARIPLTVIDWRAQPAETHEELLMEALAAEQQRAFAWETAPLLRVQIHRRSDTAFQLTLSFHHAILDGWSVATLMTELATRYFQQCGQPHLPLLPPPAVRFRDFVALERAALADPAQRRFWQSWLADRPVTVLPSWPHAAPPDPIRHVATSAVPIEPAVARALPALAQQMGLPLKSLLLAAHLRVLQRVCGQDDLVTGLTATGRPDQLDGERVLGLFLNTLPLRLRLRGGSWRALAAAAFASEQALQPNRRYPLAQIQQDLGGPPLIDTAFTFTHFHVYEGVQAMDGLELRDGDFREETNFTLLANARLRLDGAVEMVLSYDAGVVPVAQIEPISARYAQALAALVADPDATYHTADLLSDAERAHLLNPWPSVPAPVAAAGGLHQLVTTQAARTPDAMAVVAGQATLSYAALEARANQLARVLVQRGNGLHGEQRVAVLLERSAELIVALLAVLKTGAAYLPLDPSTPPARLAAVLNDSKPALVVTQRTLIEQLPADGPALLCLEDAAAEIAAASSAALSRAVDPSEAAYVIYTSGSTGTPKGVVVTHHNVTRLLAATAHWNFGPRDVWTMTHSIAFDFSVWELWGALTSGGRLIVVPSAVSRAPEELAALLAEAGVTVLNQTPSAFAALQPVLLAQTARLPLRLIIFGGEALDPARLQPWVARYGDEQPHLINMYGITETTVHVTLRRIRRADTEQGAGSVIGGPLSDLRLYVLDEAQQLAPVATPGELYVGGAGVAHGYLGLPALTAERFVPDPFSSTGARLYRSGDRARLLPDGELIYLGRDDGQVKLRGFRIELQEIAAALRSHPAVADTAVLARAFTSGDGSSDLRLVAYVVEEPRTGALWAKQEPGDEGTREQRNKGTSDEHAESRAENQELGDDTVGSQFLVLGSKDSSQFLVLGSSAGSSDLRAFLRERLPEYMIPAAFVVLPRLPLTANGKLDQRALPDPTQDGGLAEPTFEPPRTPLEQQLATIYADVLGLQRVGIHDNFFEIGGHSLVTMRVIARVRDVCRIELPLRALFDHPTVADLADHISAQQQPSVELPPLLPVDRAQPLALSFAQQRLWFLDQFEPLGAAYTIPAVLRLRGPLDRAALVRSVHLLVTRHESLRTVFVPGPDDQPVQRILPPAPTSSPLPLVDLDHLPADQREAVAFEQALDLLQQPFDLGRGPLLRAHLFRLAADDHVLLIAVHHIVADGWSMGLCIQEMTTLYQAASTGVEQPSAVLPALAVQYADFAVWQRHWLQGDVLAAQLGYWRQQLAHLPTLALPTDHARPPLPSYRGATATAYVPATISDALEQRSRQHHATVFMTLLAAFKLLLSRTTGQTDLAVGTPIAGRRWAETEPLIGFFVNTLVLRSDLSGQPTVATLLDRVRQVCLDAYAHQDVPFELLVEQLQPQRDRSRQPLFQVLFALQNLPDAPDQAAGPLTMEPIALTTATAKFDLSLFITPQRDGLVLEAEYATDLFAPATIARLLDRYQRLLAALAVPDTEWAHQPIAALPLLGPDERRQVLEQGRVIGPLPSATVHELVADQAARTPDAVAVVCGASSDSRGQLRYAELDRRSNQLAHYLQARGVGPNVPVGLYLPRSAELIVALLAVLKAGGAYLPLDPHYPAERRSFMLRDAQAPLLLTTTALRADLPLDVDALCIDALTTELEALPISAPPCRATLDDLCYLIYTSGSTGQPKGVQITHGAVSNLLATMQDQLALTPADTQLAITTLAFDIAVTELFLPLMVGARIVLASRDEAVDPVWLRAMLDSGTITVLQATPGTWRQLLTTGWRGTPGLLLISTGEALPSDLAAALLPAGRALWNLYGPTETTVWATGQRLVQATPPITIGQPLANTSAYVLDDRMEPVPVGVVGDLYLGGVQLARGYLNRPALTAELFVPDPFNSEIGARLYRTGDLARWRIDGTIEYLGRADHQIKLRGFRIEPGEIETALVEQPGVQAAAVLVHDERLVAYVVGEPRTGALWAKQEPGDGGQELRTKNQEPGDGDEGTREQPNKGTTEQGDNGTHRAKHQESGDDTVGSQFSVLGSAAGSQFSVLGSSAGSSELREALRARLPEYMIPSLFIFLDALPLTSNGKLDRRALPAPMPEAFQAQSAHETIFVAPRTPTEQALADLWQQVLGLERVGVHDDFFTLGGHSLLATQVQARLRRQLQLDLPLRALFEHATVAQLATYIEAQQRSEALPPLLPVDRGQPLALSFAQQRLWFLDQFEPLGAAYTIPLAVRLHGALDVAALATSVHLLVARHESLRTVFVPGPDDQPVQRILPPAPTPSPLPLFDLGHLPADQREAVALEQANDAAQQPFDLGRGPLLRAFLFRLEPEHHLLLLTIHHIVADGWSMARVIDELVMLYEATSTGVGEPSAVLPALAVQYADFAVWQRHWLQGNVLAAQLGYWRRQLAHLPTLALPTDHARPPLPSYRGATATAYVPAAVSDALEQRSRQHHATVFMTLLAAFKLLLSRTTGQTDLAVGTPIAGRRWAETEPLIGFFVNTLVLRSDLSGQPTVAALLDRVRQVCLDAYAHQDVPFELLVEQLQPQRDRSRQPLFQVLFALQNMPTPTQSAGSVTVEMLPVTTATAKFDLSLFITPQRDGLVLEVEYATDLFAPATIARLLDHYQRLLAALAAPDTDWTQQPIAALPLLSPDERHQVLDEWNRTALPLPAACLHELVLSQATRTPDAVAIIDGAERLDYRELQQRVAQLANLLRAHGVGATSAEVCVGVCLPRTSELIVALLAILAAGGAYVPLDPHYPADRLQFMLHDAQAPLLVTRRQLVPHLLAAQADAQLPATILALDELADTLAAQPTSLDAGNVTPDHLAYVLYTSGSTGRPKGVALQHRNAVALVRWAQQAFAADELAGVAATTSISFDLSIWELFVPLSSGGTVILAENALHLPELAAADQITLINTVPSALRELLRLDALPPMLRAVNLAGEPLPLVLAQQLRAMRPDVTLRNLYGPTETTTYSTAAAVADTERTPPIGPPISNTQIYILDTLGQPAPIGVAGELYIAGAGVARGYLNRPALTAERFIPDPFSSRAGARMYHTGDLARWLADGQIEYLGRADQQIKLRGFRIELGEIEAALQRHPAVAAAAVATHADATGDADAQQLVAYIVADAAGLEQASGAADAEQVANWQTAWNTTYAQPTPTEAVDPAFNLRGWISSYTDQPLPVVEMQSWVDQTVARIRATEPQRVLELGCGSGLLLARLAPDCAHYLGLDVSPTVISELRLHLLARPELRHVEVEARAADQLADLPTGAFDTVILNSVAQYFPSMRYLLQVIEQAVERVAEGGAIFLGDLRSLPLLEAFHTAVQLQHAPDQHGVALLREQISTRIEREQELTIDPAFFAALPQVLPRITHVTLQLKRGRAHNELTQFRYDVVLHLDHAAPPIEPMTLDWQQRALTVAELRRQLAETQPDCLLVVNVPNARLRPILAAHQRMLNADGRSTVGALRAALADDSASGIEPEELWALAERLPYRIEIGWSSASADCYDVLLVRDELPASAARLPIVASAAPTRTWSSYANQPLRKTLLQALPTELRSLLRAALPEYMIPSQFVFLDALPLTPNGKLDRRALPDPTQAHDLAHTERDSFEPPLDPLELHLARIWEDLLGVEPVGRHDSFFALGGHSLLAVRLMAQIGQRFGQKLPLSALFEGGTVARLATLLRNERPALFQPPLVAIQPGGTRRPLFLVHALWGSSLCYVDLAHHLGPDQPFFGLEALERAADQPLQTIEALAGEYVAALRQAQPEGPYLVGGWSMGGVIAYEMARQLVEQSQHVAQVAIVDSLAPLADVYRREQLDDEALIVEFIRDLPTQFRLDLSPQHLEVIAGLSDLAARTPDEHLAHALDLAHQTGLVPSDLDLAQFQQLYRIFANNLRALATYTPGPYAGRITLYRASERELAPEDDGTLGWNGLAGGVDCTVVPGDHGTIVRPPHVAVLAEQMRIDLDAATR